MTRIIPALADIATPYKAAFVDLWGCVHNGVHALPEAGAWGPITGDPWLGLKVVALPLASTWIGDSVAYFAGTAWGKAKIAPSISPNKSWVGSWAGLAGAGGAAVVWYLLVRDGLPGLPIDNLGVAALAGVLLGVGAQVGDLAESLLKREAGVKDSGTIFPGHGGVLDRLDALFFTLPLTWMLLTALERFG